MDSIQYLTRKGASCSDLLSCLYNLKPMEIEVFYQIARKGYATLDEVSEKIERDRSTTHRCLSKLVSASLVYKQARTLKDGGYYHVYAIAEPAKIREQAEQRVKEIASSLERLVGNFESDFKRHLRAKNTALYA